jgi:hypothetical protein
MNLSGINKGILPETWGEISLAREPFRYRVLKESTASLSVRLVVFPDAKPFEASMTSSTGGGFEADEITTCGVVVLGRLKRPLPSANLYTFVRTGA